MNVLWKKLFNRIISLILATVLICGGVMRMQSPAYAVEAAGVAGGAEDAKAGEAYDAGGRFLAPIDLPAAGSQPISNRSELESIRDNLKANYYLLNDIDLRGDEWIPIGAGAAGGFSGVFDGQGYVIKNMTITGAAYENTGLFGYLNGADIKNVGLSGTRIDTVSGEVGTFYNIGGICGKADSSSTIYNCFVAGVISASAVHYIDVGGICASSRNTRMTYCYNIADLSASTTFAPGQSESLTGADFAHANAAGVGGGGDNTYISYCFNSGKVEADCPAFNAAAGGISILADIGHCYNTGDISAMSNGEAYAGGISVDIWGSVSDCYNTGAVTSTGSGAILGAGSGDAGPGDAAGFDLILAGGIFTQTYPEQVDKAESINNCVNTGYISAHTANGSSEASAGGIIGNPVLPAYIDMKNCYSLDLYGNTHGARLTSAQLRDPANLSGFDFNSVWDISPLINDGYPFLRNMAFAEDNQDAEAATLNLPIDMLRTVDDKQSALDAIFTAASDMTDEQKQDATGVDLVTLYAEEAVAQASYSRVNGKTIVINESSIKSLQATANDVKTSAEQTLVASGVTPRRELNAGIKFKTDESASISILIEPSAANANVDAVRVETPVYAINFSMRFIKNNAADSPLAVLVTMNNPVSPAIAVNMTADLAASDAARFLTPSMIDAGKTPDIVLLSSTNTTTYDITFNKTLNDNANLAVPPISGDPDQQAVLNSAGDAVGGKYNPVTDKLEAKIDASDTFIVKENKKSFADISNKSAEMQNAINVLASKGIINGATATAFNPDGVITRAEIAALIVRTLSKYDPNADGGFTDVRRSDWYFGAAGSAKRHGIMKGTSATTFEPRVNIPKDQIVAVAARVLRTEMRYKDPPNINSVLSVYVDAGSLEDWSLIDIALATRENLVVKRSDGRFYPTATMTRGNVAIILYRLFMKIW